MRKKSFQDYRQVQIPYDEAMWIVDGSKKKREEELIQETKYFRDHDAERAFLLRITFDITDKDFEYFCEYIMKEYFGLKEYRVTGGYNDKWQDISWVDEKGRLYSIQCKQWATLKVTPAHIGEYLGHTYELRRDHSDTQFVYVTTGFLTKRARAFLRENNVEYIHNVKLIRIAKKLGLLKEEKWKKLEKDIETSRLRYNRWHFVTTPLSKLREQRGEDIPHHFPKSMHPEQMRVVGVK
jgi:Restriction endonuclease